MFNETFLDSSTGIALAFVQSSKVNVYPSGRRRSEAIDSDGDNNTRNNYYIPFDPESRLNTEANNRKHSSLNGFTQTYLKDWDKTNTLLTLSIAGYLFNIDLKDTSYISADEDGNYQLSEDQLGAAIHTALATYLLNESTQLYANILLEDVKLFSGFDEYYTSILRDQGSLDAPDPSLDQLNKTTAAGSNATAMQLASNYYFSGLSFSASPLTGVADTSSSIVKTAIRGNESRIQTVVSLCILEKISGNWQIHQPALLPKIEHGTTTDSIVVTGDTLLHSDLYVGDNIKVGALTETEKSVACNGGCIVAKNNITAINNITAKQNLSVENDAIVIGDTTIQSNLVVGSNCIDSSGTTGVITAHTRIDTPVLNASSELITPKASITDATITNKADINTAAITAADISSTLTVHTEGDAEAEIPANSALATMDNTIVTEILAVRKDAKVLTRTITDKALLDVEIASVDNATITEASIATTKLTTSTTINGTLSVDVDTVNNAVINNATISNELYIHRETNDAQLNADNAKIAHNLIVEGTITANTTLANNNNNLVVNKADIEIADIKTLTCENATIDDIVGTNTVSSANMYQNGYNVPIIELNESEGFYQLKISRIGAKSSAESQEGDEGVES